MAYQVVENFSAGVDTRRHPAAAPAGTLRDAVNCHITPGGEIEKRKAFVEGMDAGSTTDGLAYIRDQLYTFGTAAAPAGYPLSYAGFTLNYIQLTLPGGKTFDKILSWDIFDEKVYCVARHTDGTVSHHYDGVEVPSGKGAYVRTYQSKMYSCNGRNIFFSTVGDPTDWTTTANGAGQIDTSINDSQADNLYYLEPYYDKLAAFSERSIQLWNMDTDPANNSKAQFIRDLGAVARKSPRQYGSGDVLFVASNGIRSLQARDSSNSGSVSDIGSPIDPNMLSLRLNEQAKYTAAITTLEPDTGRFWVAFDDAIWVLSAFPGPSVTAWSKYECISDAAVAFGVTDMLSAEGHLIIRGNDDKLYFYGGASRLTYDDTEASFTTPYLTMDRTAHFKQLKAFDAALDGVWSAEVSMDPNNVAWEGIAVLSQTSYPQQSLSAQGYSTHFAIRMKTTSASAARVANLALHYDLSEDD